MASPRTDEASRLARSLVVAFAVAATAGLIAGPVFAFLTPARPFPDPGVPLRERFAMVSGALNFAFWLLLLGVVLSRLQPQPRWLDVWLAGLAVTVAVYGISEMFLVWVPSWTEWVREEGGFYAAASAGVNIVRTAAITGVGAVVAWSMVRWVRRPVGDAAATGETGEVVVAELVDRSDS